MTSGHRIRDLPGGAPGIHGQERQARRQAVPLQRDVDQPLRRAGIGDVGSDRRDIGSAAAAGRGPRAPAQWTIGFVMSGQAFVVADGPAAPGDPRQCPFDDPAAAGQDLEAHCRVPRGLAACNPATSRRAYLGACFFLRLFS
jgi:hypothetical protein